ncbi:MAG: hypothetical protein ACR2QM_19610, partial [Longimicrobiales bacterium]
LRPSQLTSNGAAQALLARQRASPFGVDMGWEVDRRLQTRFVYQPRLSDWARASVQITTIYLSQRNPDLIEVRPDSALALQRNVDGQRNLVASFTLDAGRVFPDALQRDGVVGWWSRSFDPLTFTYSSGLTSRFNREAINPGAQYQLGWGGRDDFLAIDGESAATLTERDRVTVRGGMQVGGPASVSLGYDRSLVETLDTRSDRAVLRRVWPDVRGELRDLGMPDFLSGAVQSVSVTSGYRREVRGLEFGVGGLQDRFREDEEIPLTLTLRLPRQLGLSYRGRFNRGSGADPTGDTERVANLHSVLATAFLRSPVRAFREAGTPLRVTVDLRYSDDNQCRQVTSEGACVSFIDQLERAVALSLDSTLRDFQLGVQLRYLDRRSFVGRQAGSTQFQLNVFGQFLLTAGMFPSPF